MPPNTLPGGTGIWGAVFRARLLANIRAWGPELDTRIMGRGAKCRTERFPESRWFGNGPTPGKFTISHQWREDGFNWGFRVQRYQLPKIPISF